jgi:hypothetical protein
LFFCLENIYSTGGFACGMKLVGSFDSWSQKQKLVKKGLTVRSDD